MQNNTWMDNNTKEEAKNKLENVVFKIGYPAEIYQEDVLKDMYKHVGNVTQNDSFLDIYLTFRKNNAIQKLQKVHSSYNRSQEWPHDLTKVNAYYSPLENSAVLTAVILQHPFYSFGLPSSVKLGTLGWILGHELNHAFYGPAPAMEVVKSLAALLKDSPASLIEKEEDHVQPAFPVMQVRGGASSSPLTVVLEDCSFEVTDIVAGTPRQKKLPSRTAVEVAKFFVESIVLRHGAPQVLITDRGSSFMAQLTQDIHRLSHTNHRRTTAYHPQTNGLTE
ncbi:hypothetical protein ISCGN_007748 [Ixodes scapularis]